MFEAAAGMHNHQFAQRIRAASVVLIFKIKYGSWVITFTTQMCHSELSVSVLSTSLLFGNEVGLPKMSKLYPSIHPSNHDAQ